MFVILINMLSNWCFSGQAQKLIPESLGDVWKKLLAVRRLLDTLDGYFKKWNCSLMALEMELAFSLKTFWDFNKYHIWQREIIVIYYFHKKTACPKFPRETLTDIRQRDNVAITESIESPKENYMFKKVSQIRNCTEVQSKINFLGKFRFLSRQTGVEIQHSQCPSSTCTFPSSTPFHLSKQYMHLSFCQSKRSRNKDGEENIVVICTCRVELHELCILDLSCPMDNVHGWAECKKNLKLHNHSLYALRILLFISGQCQTHKKEDIDPGWRLSCPEVRQKINLADLLSRRCMVCSF